MTIVWAGLSVGAIYVLVALGYNIVYIAAGTFNFAQANIVMVGVFIAYWGLGQGNVPLVVVFLVSIAVCVAVAIVEERICFRPVKHYEGHLVTSVGAATLITGIVIKIWGADALKVPFLTHGTNSYSAPLDVLGGRVLPVELALIGVALASSIALYLALRWTLTGLASLATSEDREAASLRGVNTRLLSLGAFGLSGLLAGLIGPVVGPKTYAFAALAAALALKGFVAMAMGGFGSIVGCTIGGFVVGMVEALTARWIGGAYQSLAVFVLLLLVLMIRPTGILGEQRARVV